MENVGFDPLRIHGSVHTAAYNHTIGTQKTATVTIAERRGIKSLLVTCFPFRTMASSS